MNWQSLAIYAAIVIISGIILIFMRRKNWIGNITAFIVFFLIIAAWSFINIKYILPVKEVTNEFSEYDSAMSKLPIFMAIKAYNPNGYHQLQEKILKLKQEGKTEPEIMSTIQPEISSLLTSRIYYAPDTKVIIQMGAILAQVEQLKALKNGSCFKFLFPAVKGGINPAKLLPIDIIQQRMVADGEMISSSYLSPRNAKPEEENIQAKEIMEPILQDLLRQYGNDLQMAINPAGENVDPEKTCEIMAQFYSKILELPVNESAKVIRLIQTK